MKIKTDRRGITGQRQGAAEQRLQACAAQLRTLQIAAAKDLEKIESSNHYALVGCSSLIDFGVRMGFGAYETRQYANLGKAIAARPELEMLVQSGEIRLAAAAVIGRVLCSPELLRPGDAWIEYARNEPMKALRKRVRQRLEEHAQGIGATRGSRAVEVSVFVREEVRENFERARLIASRKAKRALTDGQTLAAIVDSYLDAYDPDRQAIGTRRLGPTGELPGSRYVPAAVRREVFARAGGCCEAPGCTNKIFLQLAHRVPHRRGSGREATDLILLCLTHHTLYDAGFWKLDGPSDLQLPGEAERASPPRPSATSRKGAVETGPPERVRESGPSLAASRSWRAVGSGPPGPWASEGVLRLNAETWIPASSGAQLEATVRRWNSSRLAKPAISKSSDYMSSSGTGTLACVQSPTRHGPPCRLRSHPTLS